MDPTIRHHLSEDLLLAYAAGRLREAYDLVIASHVSLCDECRARLGAHEAVGGALLDAGEEAGIASDALERTLARIESGAPEPAETPRPDPAAVLPAPVRAYVGGDLDAVRWRAIGGGVKQAVLPTATDAKAALISIPAGTAIPDHGHRGLELTLVLQGAYSDETDRFARGDVEIADEEMQHIPVAETGATCICLAATDAPLRFTALLPRLAQKLLRI